MKCVYGKLLTVLCSVLILCAQPPAFGSFFKEKKREEASDDKLPATLKRKRNEELAEVIAPLAKRLRPRRAVSKISVSSGDSPKSDRSGSSKGESNWSDELEGAIIDIDRATEAQIQQFLLDKSSHIDSIASKPEHPMHEALFNISELLLKEDAYFRERVALIQRLDGVFRERVATLNDELNEKVGQILEDMAGEFDDEIKGHGLQVDLKPVQLEYLAHKPYRLSDSDNKRATVSAAQIQDDLIVLSYRAHAFKSSQNDSARLGTFKHSYCRNVIKEAQKKDVFNGLLHLNVERAYSGPTALILEQRPDLYWEAGGAVFDYKFGKSSIAESDMELSAQVLPYYSDSYQITPIPELSEEEVKQ